ncbi:GNAT family N-acetyltransferase [Streptomyces sp. H27-H1]|uniref:GNAT family N-acetyltransferase n=1 Tax=Streptomyces sp. H27-H1 TaxID=2996461 RepID=UPI00226FA226|nr:GNAT family N-acetyltransferase [Streptomyces sp. H27-H1]MCY0929924.1 GNAT family N-acetyltransferase [Streptomyces sp. H27-H1]
MAELRAARPGEAEALTDLVMRSKAHWGYGAGFLAACAPELRIEAGDVERRRIVVAGPGARSGGGPAAVLGLASLDGEPPLGRLGLLFVEPAAIGGGVGRLLYRDVVRRAAELGFRRLLIDADPHARGFYRAMGAVGEGPGPGPDALGALVPFEVAPAPLADWARAWTGGAAAVHVGNVAEYNAQFADASLDRGQTAAHHYACLAAFYSPRPAALVLPRPVPQGWISLLGRQLDWPAGVEVYDGLAERDPDLSDAVRARPALAARLAGTGSVTGALAGAPLVPWGLTAPFARLARRPWRPEELRYESKSAAHGLFGRILAEGGHPAITLPAQWRAPTRRAAVRLLASRTGAGESTVLKSEHGVGGSGTTVVTPERIRAAGGARAVVRALPRGPLLVEEYVRGPADPDEPRDLTYDGFVDARGRVHEVGGAVMDVADGGYRGATVGPGVVPGWAQEPLLAFGGAVGRELSAAGYRGWFDVDFVADGAGRLAPTETNLRLTGPSVAFVVAARLDELRGAGHFVRIVDRVELGARLPEAAFDDLCERLVRRCAGTGAVFLPAIPTGAFEPAPWMGALVAAAGRELLDAAERLVRAEALSVGAMFEQAGGAQPAGPEAASRAGAGSGFTSKALSGGREA